MLWGHYAAKHKGIVLGFDVDDKFPQPVDYTDKRLKLIDFKVTSLANALRNPEIALKIVNKLISTKFRAWEYEAEYRLFIALDDKDPVTDLYYKSFVPAMTLKQVIVGERCSITRAKLTEVLGDDANSIDMFKARASSNKFEVVRSRSKSTWK